MIFQLGEGRRLLLNEVVVDSGSFLRKLLLDRLDPHLVFVTDLYFLSLFQLGLHFQLILVPLVQRIYVSIILLLLLLVLTIVDLFDAGVFHCHLLKIIS